MKKKSRKWFFHFPGQTYANDFVFNEAVDVEEAKEYVRWWLGHTKEQPERSLPRLPRGTGYWEGK